MIDGPSLRLPNGGLTSCPIRRPRCSALLTPSASSLPPSPRGMGADSEVSAELARHLVGSNLAGHDSHGVIRVPQYVGDTDQGVIVPSARPVIAPGTPVAALVDARRGFGQHSTMFALEWAMARARQHGVAMVAVRHSTHIGRLGEYAERTAIRGSDRHRHGGGGRRGDRRGRAVRRPVAVPRNQSVGPVRARPQPVPDLRRRHVDGRRGQGPGRAGRREAAAARRHPRPRRPPSGAQCGGFLRGRRAPASRWNAGRAQGLRARARLRAARRRSG